MSSATLRDVKAGCNVQTVRNKTLGKCLKHHKPATCGVNLPSVGERGTPLKPVVTGQWLVASFKSTSRIGFVRLRWMNLEPTATANSVVRTCWSLATGLRQC